MVSLASPGLHPLSGWAGSSENKTAGRTPFQNLNLYKEALADWASEGYRAGRGKAACLSLSHQGRGWPQHAFNGLDAECVGCVKDTTERQQPLGKTTLLFIKSWLYRNTYLSCLENKVCLRLHLPPPTLPRP